MAKTPAVNAFFNAPETISLARLPIIDERDIPASVLPITGLKLSSCALWVIRGGQDLFAVNPRVSANIVAAIDGARISIVALRVLVAEHPPWIVTTPHHAQRPERQQEQHKAK